MQQVLASLQSKHATLLSKFGIAGILASSNFGKVDTCNEPRSLQFMEILLGFKGENQEELKKVGKVANYLGAGGNEVRFMFSVGSNLKAHYQKKTRKAVLCPNLGKIIIYTC